MSRPIVHHRFAAAADLSPLVRRPPAAWLSERELAELARWRDSARRAQWLAGRALAKQLVADALADQRVSITQIEIASRPDTPHSGRPRVLLSGHVQPWSLSLAHTDAATFAALCVTAGCSVGVDLVSLPAAPQAALTCWFTRAEQRFVAAGGSPAFLWAAKEAVYKAANHGEPFAPRDIQVTVTASDTSSDWQPPGRPDIAVFYRHQPLGRCCQLLDWQPRGQLAVLALIRQPPTPVPSPLTPDS
jgi:4'-phosphopantetheinyl transferase EntD